MKGLALKGEGGAITHVVTTYGMDMVISNQQDLSIQQFYLELFSQTSQIPYHHLTPPPLPPSFPLSSPLPLSQQRQLGRHHLRLHLPWQHHQWEQMLAWSYPQQ